MFVEFLFAFNRNKWNIGSPLLRWAEKLPCSHFAILVDYQGVKTVYESVWPKSRKMEFAEWQTHYGITHRFKFGVQAGYEGRVLRWLNQQLGKSYGIDQILFIGLTMVAPLINLFANKVVLNGNRYLICTELGSRFAEKFWGFKPLESHDEIGLRDMLNISEKYEGKQIVWGESND